jgi:hypothetical protein
MDFILQRYSDNRQSTLGLLLKKVPMGSSIKTMLQAYTLEDESREVKVSGETRIPAGFYELVIHKQDTPLTLKYRAKYSWFKNHIEIKNVTGFEGVYIHIGNYDSNTEGCILLGDSVDNNSISEGMITNSTTAFKRFYDMVYTHLEAGNKAHIEIRDESTLK